MLPMTRAPQATVRPMPDDGAEESLMEKPSSWTVLFRPHGDRRPGRYHTPVGSHRHTRRCIARPRRDPESAMNIRSIDVCPLAGATVDGGWPEGIELQENLHTLIIV